MEDEAQPTRHFHCYLLKSDDPKHPIKTYVGFTTNPHRRLRQHNGDLKHGGAFRTRKSGRPWRFVAIIHGFPTQKSALQFEWAWQHCDGSIAVRGRLGRDYAKTMKRKRGAVGQLAIMHMLLTHCVQEICGCSHLTVYFFEQQYKTRVLKLIESDRQFFPQSIELEVASHLSELPFMKQHAKRTRKPSRAGLRNDEQPEESPRVRAPMPVPAPRPAAVDRAQAGGCPLQEQPCTSSIPTNDCMWCRRPIRAAEEIGATVCDFCGEMMHEVCSDIHAENQSGMCPSCKAPFGSNADDTSMDEDSDGADFMWLNAACCSHSTDASESTSRDAIPEVVEGLPQTCDTEAQIEAAAAGDDEEKDDDHDDDEKDNMNYPPWQSHATSSAHPQHPRTATASPKPTPRSRVPAVALERAQEGRNAPAVTGPHETNHDDQSTNSDVSFNPLFMMQDDTDEDSDGMFHGAHQQPIGQTSIHEHVTCSNREVIELD